MKRRIQTIEIVDAVVDSVLVLFFVALFLSYDNAFAANSTAQSISSCSDTLKSLLSLDHVANTLTPSQENQLALEKMARNTATEKTNSLAEEFEQAVNGPQCFSNPDECLAKAAAEALDPESKRSTNFVSDFFGKSCLASGRAGALPANLALAAANRSSLAMSLVVGLGGVGFGYTRLRASNPNAQFPFAILADTVVSVLLRSEVACRNMAKSAGAPAAPGVAAAVPLSWGRQALSNYVAYGVWIVPSAGIYVGCLMAEDLIRGEEVFNKDKMQEYLRDGSISMVWDLGSNVLQVTVLDRFFLKQLPAGRNWVTDLLKNRVFVGALKPLGNQKLLIVEVNELPGYLLDLGLRVTNSGLRTSAYVKLSSAVQSHFEKKPSAPITQPTEFRGKPGNNN